MKDKFFAERKKSLAWLIEHEKTDLGTVYKSEWGEMSAGDMFASWVAHDNLHVCQLVELRRLKFENIAKTYETEYAGDW